MQPVGQIVEFALWLFTIVIIVRLVAEWVQMFARSWQPRGPVLVVLEAAYTITDPPIKAVRRVVPPLRLGSVALDLSLLLVLVACWVLRGLNQAFLLS